MGQAPVRGLEWRISHESRDWTAFLEFLRHGREQVKGVLVRDPERRNRALERLRASALESRTVAIDMSGHLGGLVRSISSLRDRIEREDFDEAQLDMDLLVAKVQELISLRGVMVALGWLTPLEEDVKAKTQDFSKARNVLAHYDEYLLRAGHISQDPTSPFGRHYMRSHGEMAISFYNPYISVSLSEVVSFVQDQSEEMLAALETRSLRWATPESSEGVEGLSSRVLWFEIGDYVSEQDLKDPSVTFRLAVVDQPLELGDRGIWINTSSGVRDIRHYRSTEEILGRALGDGLVAEIRINGEVDARVYALGQWILTIFPNVEELLVHDLNWRDPETIKRGLQPALERVWSMVGEPVHHVSVLTPFLSPHDEDDVWWLTNFFPMGIPEARLNDQEI